MHLQFLESTSHATLSGLPFFGDSIGSARTYSVDTVSLVDLLREANAPKCIDYLSIDTEGSELAILNSFDFQAYVFKVITVEHNFRDDEIEIVDLLTRNGYIQVAPNLSGIEAWFVNSAFDYPNISHLLKT